MPAPAVDRSTEAERLRHGVNRLARLLRHQDEGDIGATSTAALATVRKRGQVTLGELAALEQVAPPTMTKVIEKLEGRGFVSRRTDPADRRVTRVSITPAGTRYLDRSRARRTAWLAARIGELEPHQLAQLEGAIELLETLIGEPEHTDSAGRRDR